MADELCMASDPTTGKFCTEKKGHSGDHVAKSGAPAVTQATWPNQSKN